MWLAVTITPSWRSNFWQRRVQILCFLLWFFSFFYYLFFRSPPSKRHNFILFFCQLSCMRAYFYKHVLQFLMAPFWGTNNLMINVYTLYFSREWNTNIICIQLFGRWMNKTSNSSIVFYISYGARHVGKNYVMILFLGSLWMQQYQLYFCVLFSIFFPMNTFCKGKHFFVYLLGIFYFLSTKWSFFYSFSTTMGLHHTIL